MYECVIIGESTKNNVNKSSTRVRSRKDMWTNRVHENVGAVCHFVTWLVNVDHHFDTCYTDFYRHNSFLHPRGGSIARPTVYWLILDRCREIRVTSKGNINERVIMANISFRIVHLTHDSCCNISRYACAIYIHCFIAI